MNNEQFNERLEALLKEYLALLNNEAREIWNTWEIDLTQNEVYEVLGGLLSRQITLASGIVQSSVTWNNHIAPLILRSMADNYINFVWIIEKPQERSQKFIMYGLGQEKLMLAHRKVELEKQGIDPNNDEVIIATEAWLSFQRYPFLTEVNLGSWSGISTRQMAEESGCIDFYNYVYQPFSAAVHNTWGHIAKHNLIPSDNALHRFLKKPLLVEFDAHIDYIELAVKYMDKVLYKFDEKYKHAEYRISSSKYFYEELEKLFSELESSSN